MRLEKYQHYKGSTVEVIGVAKHSETLEELVVYKKLEAYNGYRFINIFKAKKNKNPNPIV